MSPPPGAVLVLHSLPLDFPLAMAFAEQLLTYSIGEASERSEDELDTVPTSVLLQVVELFGENCFPIFTLMFLILSVQITLVNTFALINCVVSL